MTRTRYKHILLLAFDHGFDTKSEPFILASGVVEALAGVALMSTDEIEFLLDYSLPCARAMKNAIGDAYVAGRWGEYEQVN